MAPAVGLGSRQFESSTKVRVVVTFAVSSMSDPFRGSGGSKPQAIGRREQRHPSEEPLPFGERSGDTSHRPIFRSVINHAG